MYIYDTEGLGRDRKLWSAPVTLNQAVRSVPWGHLDRLQGYMGKTEESCEARYKVEYFNPGSDKLNRLIKTDLKDISIHMFKLLKAKLAKLKGRKVDLKKDVILHINTKGYVDVYKESDPQDHDYLDTRRAFAVLEPLHLYAMQKGIPRKNIEYDYSGGGNVKSRNPRKPGINRLATVCIRWEIK